MRINSFSYYSVTFNMEDRNSLLKICNQITKSEIFQNVLSQVKRMLKEEDPQCDAEDVIQAFKHYLLEMHLDPSEIMPVDEWRTELWQRALNSYYANDLAIKAYQTWKSTRLQNIHFTEPVKQLLSDLHRNYKLLLLTNGDSQVQWEKIAQVGAKHYFDGIIVSGDHPHPKPHPSIFAFAFRVLGAAPSECIMVGDSLNTDIQGGVNAGVLATVWVDPKRQNAELVFPRPDFSIPSVLDVRKVLDEMSAEQIP